jgi:hypothetical protein
MDTCIPSETDLPLAQRIRQPWYTKRINDQQQIKQHLIEQIQRHQTRDFPWTRAQLEWLNYEDLLELAVVCVRPDLSIVLGSGQDWSDGRDGKVSIARINNYGRNYSAGITGCRNKTHIAAVVWEWKQQKFYYFDFPVQLNKRGEKMTEHTIPFDLDTGYPKRITRNGENQMWQYECSSFEDLCWGRRLPR